jgi:hypothetical protein
VGPGVARTVVRGLLGTPRMATQTSAAATEELRDQVSRVIQRTTDLIADLQTLARAFETVAPELREATASERWREVARISALDLALPEMLSNVVEALADVLAGLTSADAGGHWLAHQRARLDAGEDAATA